MSFWKRKSKGSSKPIRRGDRGRVEKAKKPIKRSPPVPMEVKILAIEALESGLSANEVGELVGVGSGTIHKWRKDYEESGVQGLCRKASSIATRKQCSVLEEKIVAHRESNPEHGVRRIRDDLRRHEGLEVSAEKVRTVVNESGLGNSPPQARRLTNVPFAECLSEKRVAAFRTAVDAHDLAIDAVITVVTDVRPHDSSPATPDKCCDSRRFKSLEYYTAFDFR